ncbi:hypothetical protein, partial [Paenibacillus polymyxa]|uniref:hypothetical protein n=1 Tax=Paenibacillus polymyxa TaxID=1406 RepID=UPI0006C25E13
MLCVFSCIAEGLDQKPLDSAKTITITMRYLKNGEEPVVFSSLGLQTAFALCHMTLWHWPI